jgi:hypothetical protein
MKKDLNPSTLSKTTETGQSSIKRSPFYSILPASGQLLNTRAKFSTTSLPKYLSDDLEKLQKRACRIVLPDHPYNEA